MLRALCPRVIHEEENKVKKFLAIVLALTVVLGLCSACGGNEQVDQGEEGKIKIEIGVAADASVSDYDDNVLTKWLEEKTGLDIEITEYAGGTDVSTQVSATIAAGQALPGLTSFSCVQDSTLPRTLSCWPEPTALTSLTQL